MNNLKQIELNLNEKGEEINILKVTPASKQEFKSCLIEFNLNGKNKFASVTFEPDKKPWLSGADNYSEGIQNQLIAIAENAFKKKVQFIHNSEPEDKITERKDPRPLCKICKNYHWQTEEHDFEVEEKILG